MTPDPNINDARHQLQQVGKSMVEHRLAWGNAGNISARTAPDRFLITATGTRLDELAPDDLVECDFDGSYEGERRPSKEIPMHRAVYEERPEINVVLHASPFYSTLFACSKEAIPGDLFVEDMYYLERVARVPYFNPGTQALGDAVSEQAANANILLLENHGVLVYDVNVKEAFMALQVLEYTCRMLVSASSAGIALAHLPPATVSDFLNKAGYKPRRQWSS